MYMDAKHHGPVHLPLSSTSLSYCIAHPEYGQLL